VPLGVFKKIK